MKRICITNTDNETMNVSGYGDSRYFKYDSPTFADLTAAIQFVKECWDLHRAEDSDVIIEIDVPRDVDPDARLMAEFDEQTLRRRICQMRNARYKTPRGCTIEKCEQHTLLHFPCDDDPQGFTFQVLQASDGDFHLSVVPNRNHPMREHFSACCSASVRIRMPMVGGGMHDNLWQGLANAVNAERQKQKK